MSSINFTVLELLNSRELITKIVESKCGDGVFKFHLATIVKAINEELTKFDNVKNDLFNKYGTQNLENNTIEVGEENKEVFSKEISRLLNLQVELNINLLNPEYLNSLDLEIEDYFKILKFLQK